MSSKGGLKTKTCQCGCRQKCYNRWVQGHNRRVFPPPVWNKDKTGVQEPWNKGRTGIYSVKSLAKMGAATLRRMRENPGPFKDTKPELAVERWLQEQGVLYEKQYPIGNMLTDFYLLEQDMVIEVDGCWWHGCECSPNSPHPDNSTRRSQKLSALGYAVIHIWEHEIISR